LNLSEIKASFYTNRRESSGNSIFSAAEVTQFVNDAYRDVMVRERWRFGVKDFSLTIPATAITADYTAGGTSLTVASTAGYGKNRSIIVTDGTNFEYATISAHPTATGLTISALANSYATGSYVILAYCFLPHNCLEVMACPRGYSSTNGWVQIQGLGVGNFDYFVSGSLSFSSPSKIILGGMATASEGTFTGTTGTSSTVFVAATAGNLQDNYYNGWLLSNRTHSGTARILSYVASTKTFTLDRAITGQASGDVVEIIPMLKQAFFYPYPIENTTIYFRGRLDAGKLVNNYDEVSIPAEYAEVISWGALERSFIADRNSELAMNSLSMVHNKFMEILSRMVMKEIYTESITNQSYMADPNDMEV